jgi:hypothetical protein
MTTEKDIYDARDWLVTNARKCAEAKAERVYCEEYKKSLKAILFNEYEGTVAERENKAYSDSRYLKHLAQLKQAVYEDENLKALRCAAEIKISMWQTEQANLRGMRV